MDLGFLKAKEVPVIPDLKLSHKYPILLPNIQGGQGGIKNLIFGDDVIIPGMTSLGSKLLIEKEIPRNLVTVLCEGIENAIAIGQIMSAGETKNQGKGIEIKVHTNIQQQYANANPYTNFNGNNNTNNLKMTRIYSNNIDDNLQNQKNDNIGIGISSNLQSKRVASGNDNISGIENNNINNVGSLSNMILGTTTRIENNIDKKNDNNINQTNHVTQINIAIPENANNNNAINIINFHVSSK